MLLCPTSQQHNESVAIFNVGQTVVAVGLSASAAAFYICVHVVR